MSTIPLPQLIQIARQAGQAILGIYHSDFSVEEKSDASPVTEADLKAHDILTHELAKTTPSLPVLSEESPHVPLDERQHWQRYWLIDPLDGTREFIRKSDEFTINIALIDRHSPILGLIYAPVSGICYYAQQGGGAFRHDPDNQIQRIRTRKLHRDNFVVTTSHRALHDQPTQAFLRHLPDYQLLTVGSAMKSCLVAEGKADIYPRIGPTAEWDTAAAQIIIEEAGGQLTDLTLQPLRYNTKESLLNPDFLAAADRSVDWKRYF